VVGLGLLILALGVSMILRPQWGWEMSRWAYRNPEAVAPSNAYFAYLRAIGAALVVFAVFFVLLPT
jgi:hypothetical protein